MVKTNEERRKLKKKQPSKNDWDSKLVSGKNTNAEIVQMRREGMEGTE